MKKYALIFSCLSLLLGGNFVALAEPPNISTVATDLLDLSPEGCLAKAAKTIENSPMEITTKASDFVAGTWQDYKAMILCRQTSTNQIIVVFMVAGQGTEKVELMAARLAEIFKD